MQPKTINILYWVFTILFSALMIFSSYGSILVTEDAKKMIHEQLGYPVYFIPFTGWAKLIGAIVILITVTKNNKRMGLCGAVLRPGCSCILGHCLVRKGRPDDGLHVGMVCSGHPVVHFL